ncbi:uncharacterized protein H6S33_003826 [Morchella sextelata]|uniref:uncharacterized protein n=1 Tax=Morchella sextelata TaxID=1174677 RepID=UPI001D055DC8|nr:uncharacterized protein H6S33_003826 [Morchella sextelata]KAH0606165.1 hypothetical protein H6S33_003826 [Morchella sextelata]
MYCHQVSPIFLSTGEVVLHNCGLSLREKLAPNPGYRDCVLHCRRITNFLCDTSFTQTFEVPPAWNTFGFIQAIKHAKLTTSPMGRLALNHKLGALLKGRGNRTNPSSPRLQFPGVRCLQSIQGANESKASANIPDFVSWETGCSFLQLMAKTHLTLPTCLR